MIVVIIKEGTEGVNIGFKEKKGDSITGVIVEQRNVHGKGKKKISAKEEEYKKEKIEAYEKTYGHIIVESIIAFHDAQVEQHDHKEEKDGHGSHIDDEKEDEEKFRT